MSLGGACRVSWLEENDIPVRNDTVAYKPRQRLIYGAPKGAWWKRENFFSRAYMITSRSHELSPFRPIHAKMRPTFLCTRTCSWALTTQHQFEPRISCVEINKLLQDGRILKKDAFSKESKTYWEVHRYQERKKNRPPAKLSSYNLISFKFKRTWLNLTLQDHLSSNIAVKIRTLPTLFKLQAGEIWMTLIWPFKVTQCKM